MAKETAGATGRGRRSLALTVGAMLAWGAIAIPIDGPVAAASAGEGPACPDTFPQGQFGDVGPDNVHRRAVDCSASWRVVDGVRLGEYGPAATLTRGQAASVVVRLIIVAGGALPPSPVDAFADDGGSVHEGAIDQLAAAGVIDGTAPGVYQPGAPVTRDQLATILQGALDNRGAAAASSAEDLFTDDDGSVHEASINALVTAGVLSGRSPGVFEPRGPARRDQVATAMVGVLDRLVAQGLAEPPDDPRRMLRGGHILDWWGAVHAFGGAPAMTSSLYTPGVDSARGLAMRADGQGGYVVDAAGAVHEVGDAPAVDGAARWPGHDVARGIAPHPGGGGYVLDWWGAVHAFGGAPAMTSSLYTPGVDSARGLAMRADGQGGYVVEAAGAVHEVGDAPAVDGTARWPGHDVARGIAPHPGGGGYVLDSWGAVHAFGGAPAMTTSLYMPGVDSARGLFMLADGSGGYTVDAEGAFHPVGNPPPIDSAPRWPGQDVARGVAGPGGGSGARNGQGPTKQAWVPFATVGGVTLRHPASLVERIGFHQANHDGARQLDPSPTAVKPFTMASRGRGTALRSAADVVVDPAEVIRAPVSGRVTRAGNYTLYCRYTDGFAVIEPDDRPGYEVKLLHINGVRVRRGDRVTAGETVVASRATVLPLLSQVDDVASADPPWPHVHIEVIDLAIPDRPSPGGGC